MTKLYVLSRGTLTPQRIEELKFLLDKMVNSAPFHIRISIYILESIVLTYSIIRYRKPLLNLNEVQLKNISYKLEHSKFQGFQMISKLQKSATYLVMHD